MIFNIPLQTKFSHPTQITYIVLEGLHIPVLFLFEVNFFPENTNDYYIRHRVYVVNIQLSFCYFCFLSHLSVSVKALYFIDGSNWVSNPLWSSICDIFMKVWCQKEKRDVFKRLFMPLFGLIMFYVLLPFIPFFVLDSAFYWLFLPHSSDMTSHWWWCDDMAKYGQNVCRHVWQLK